MEVTFLPDESKQVLSACLFKLSKLYDYPSSDQQEFADNVLNYIKTTTIIDNVEAALDRLGEDHRRIILTCCMEYIFLNNKDFETSDELDDFIDGFNIGNRSIKGIKERIGNICDLRGSSGVIEKYSSDNFFSLDKSGFLLEIEEGDDEIDDSADSTDLVDNIVESYKEIPLDIAEKVRAKRFNAIETKDYVLMHVCIVHGNPFLPNRTIESQILRYDKSSEAEVSISSFTAQEWVAVFGKLSGLDFGYSNCEPYNNNGKTCIIDYHNNTVYYIKQNEYKQNILCAFDVNADTNKAFDSIELIPCNISDIKSMQIHNGIIVVSTKTELFYVDIRKEIAVVVKDYYGKSISESASTILDDKIYFYSYNAATLFINDSNNIKDWLCAYDIHTKSFERIVQSPWPWQLFRKNTQIYASFSKDDSYSFAILTKADTGYRWDEICKHYYSGYDGALKIFENFAVFYHHDDGFCPESVLYSILVYNFEKRTITKVIDDCYLYYDDGLFKHKWLKSKSFYSIIGQFIYYYKDLLYGDDTFTHLFRTNINYPLSSTDLGLK